MKRITLALLLCCLAATACAGANHKHRKAPPGDPIANTPAEELRARGLGFARRGDLTRAQQYLRAAQLKGFDERIVVPELVKICVAASRLQGALLYAQPYLERHPEDAAMRYVVGAIHLALGNLQEASAHLSGALEPGEVMIEAAFSLAIVARAQGRAEEARAHLAHYLALRPQGRFAVRARRLLGELGGAPEVQL